MIRHTHIKDSESNIHYRFSDIDTLKNDKELLLSIVNHHNDKQVPRLQMLLDYYKGQNTSILHAPVGKRRKEKTLADNRIPNNFGRYVSQFIQGYMVGKPIQLSFSDENEDKKVVDYITEINNVNHVNEVNSDIALDQSIFGRAYELVYRAKDKEGKSRTRFIDLDVRNTFVIYDTTVDRNPIGAVRHMKHRFEGYVSIYLYTTEEIIEYRIEDDEMVKHDTTLHHFGEVPIIECENNKFREGDFENVIGGIDAYDAAISDTANYMTDLNDAMLKIEGDVDISVAETGVMKDANIIIAKPERDSEGRVSPTPKVDYIYKQYDVQGSEAYKTRLADDILRFTSMPDLTNHKSSSGGDSASAMKMRLFGLEQKRAPKEQMFQKFLFKRYELIANMAEKASEPKFNPSDIHFVFTENLPSMIDQEMKWFIDAGGRLSDQTLWEQLSIVKDAQEESNRIDTEEREYNEKRNREMLGMEYPFATEVGDKDE